MKITKDKQLWLEFCQKSSTVLTAMIQRGSKKEIVEQLFDSQVRSLPHTMLPMKIFSKYKYETITHLLKACPWLSGTLWNTKPIHGMAYRVLLDWSHATHGLSAPSCYGAPTGMLLSPTPHTKASSHSSPVGSGPSFRSQGKCICEALGRSLKPHQLSDPRGYPITNH